MTKKALIISALAVIVLAVLIFIVPNLLFSNTPRLSEVNGYVNIIKNGSDQKQIATKGMVLEKGDQIITGESAWVVLKFDNYKEVTIFRNSIVSISELGKAENSDVYRIVLDLSTGRLMPNITKKLTAQEEFEIKTPTTVASCRGTMYYVDQLGDSTTVGVFEGLVATSTNGASNSSVDIDLEKNQQAVLVSGIASASDVQITGINTDSFDYKALQCLKENGNRVDQDILNGIDIQINEKKKAEAESSASGNDSVSALIDAVKGIKENNKDLFMNAIKYIGDKAIPGLRSMNYGQAKQTFIAAIKDHTGVDLSLNSQSVDDAVNAVTASIMAGFIDEAKHYNVDITGLSLIEAEAKLDSAKQVYMAKELEELNDKAQQYNIDITGLSKDDAWAKVKTAEQAANPPDGSPDLRNKSELEAQAQRLGVDITGLSTEDAIQKVKEALNAEEKAKKEASAGSGDLNPNDIEGLRKAAAKCGIDVSGMTDEQISQQVPGMVLAIRAKDLGIDISGLSVSDAQAKVNAATWAQMEADAEKFGVDITGLSMNDAYEVLKKGSEAYQIQDQWNRLKARAEYVGMNSDFTGLTYEQAEAKVVEAEAYFNERKPLLEQAAQWGFDPSGMTNAEIDAKITELLKSPHDFPEQNSNNGNNTNVDNSGGGATGGDSTGGN